MPINRFVRPSKSVTDGQKLALLLESAARDIAPAVAPSLDAAFAPWVEEGESPPTHEAFRQVLLGRWLSKSRLDLIATDERHQKAVRRERFWRRQRDENASTIEQRIRAVRTTFQKVYGDKVTEETIGLGSDIPEDAVVLERYGRRIVAVMTDAQLSLPSPRVQGSAMGPAEVVEEIKPFLDPLHEAIEALPSRIRATQKALKEKRAALEAFRFASGRIARYLEALCFLAGEDFHAERVRQSFHESLEDDETSAQEEPPEKPEDQDSEEGSEAEEGSAIEESQLLVAEA